MAPEAVVNVIRELNHANVHVSSTCSSLSAPGHASAPAGEPSKDPDRGGYVVECNAEGADCR